MLRLAGWMTTAIVLGLLVWQLASEYPVLPRPFIGLMLVVISGLAGLRIATNSAAAYIKDLQRLNKVLAEQNKELEETNAMLLREVSTGSKSPQAPERH